MTLTFHACLHNTLCQVSSASDESLLVWRYINFQSQLQSVDNGSPSLRYIRIVLLQQVDPVTGMVLNLKELDHYMQVDLQYNISMTGVPPSRNPAVALYS